MNLLIDPIKNEQEYKELYKEAIFQSKKTEKSPLLLTGLSDGSRFGFDIAVSGDWKNDKKASTLLIVPDEAGAFLVAKVFSEFGLKAEIYPYRDFSYSRINASHAYEYERLSVLDKIKDGKADIFITTPDAALQYTIPRKKLESLAFKFKMGDVLPPEVLTDKLEKLGYTRADMVEGEGQYSVRGGICDIFPPKYENPIRIEYFDDEIDRIGSFDVLTQRTVEMEKEITLTPAREVIVSENGRTKIAKIIENQIRKCKKENTLKELREELEIVKTGRELSFADKYISVIYEEKECFLDYFNKDTLFIMRESNQINDRLKGYRFHLKETTEMLISEGYVPGNIADYGKYPEDFENYISENVTVYCNAFVSNIDRLAGMYNLKSKQGITYRENIDLMLEDIERYIDSGYKINILTENEALSKRMCGILLDKGIASTVEAEPKAKIPNFVSGINMPPFELTTSKYVCISMFTSVFSQGKILNGKNKHIKRKKKSAKERINSYAELEIGDYVVHENHGIGRYLGLSTVTMNGITNDYIKLEYAGDGCLYLPCTQLDMLSKYIGAAEGGTVKLSKLGGSDWGKAKLKAKVQAKEMAKELIALYAERMRKKGIAFEKDDEMQEEFEGAFEYEETEGQLEAADEIKEDMEKAVPMERLLCGDVGYGKTEVALRAAFKAVKSGYQVAILVPTTILALQHYQTVLARFRGFPIAVDMMSRFRKPKEIKQSVSRIKEGKVDIVIGTHRILSKDVEFKKLGLVIIDEEQRFGVAQKEKLKQLVKNVDVLTLSATPIPRTLNMAMSGIRDMSVLDEPPLDRVPVQTYVLEYDDAIIGEAIRKELRRGGQVFFLHNRIETLDQVAAKVLEYAPDASVAIAHGRMDKEELSDIWRQMLEGDVNVLVCTTLIEAGVDIPNANTLIIDNADRYGLSQLHQIRGRVGRSGRRAYAYLTYRKGAALSEIAEKRLEALRDFTEFGSGFRVAMRDMEIRGAGNILGSQQHGQIETVGYDLYMKILNEAVLEEKGEVIEKIAECTVTMDVDAFIPEKYIKSTAQRIDAYKKIAQIEDTDDKNDVTDELTDRYGAVPKETAVLIDIAYLRSLGRRAGVSKIEYKNMSCIFYVEEKSLDLWYKMVAMGTQGLFVSAGMKPYITLRMSKSGDKISISIALLKKYIQIRDIKPVEKSKEN